MGIYQFIVTSYNAQALSHDHSFQKGIKILMICIFTRSGTKLGSKWPPPFNVQSTLFIVESLVSRKLSTIARFPLFRKFLKKMHMGYQFSVEFNAEMKNEDNFYLIFLIYSKVLFDKHYKCFSCNPCSANGQHFCHYRLYI